MENKDHTDKEQTSNDSLSHDFRYTNRSARLELEDPELGILAIYFTEITEGLPLTAQAHWVAYEVIRDESTDYRTMDNSLVAVGTCAASHAFDDVNPRDGVDLRFSVVLTVPKLGDDFKFSRPVIDEICGAAAWLLGLISLYDYWLNPDSSETKV